jgi:hypothetical protein
MTGTSLGTFVSNAISWLAIGRTPVVGFVTGTFSTMRTYLQSQGVTVVEVPSFNSIHRLPVT